MAWLPAIIGAIVGDVSQNSQNKAANKNNDNQQQAQWLHMQQAIKQFQTWMAANPAPFKGMPGGPTGNYGTPSGSATPINASSLLSPAVATPPAGPTAGGTPQPNGPTPGAGQQIPPQIAQLIQQAIAQHGAQGSAPGGNPPTVNTQMPTQPPPAIAPSTAAGLAARQPDPNGALVARILANLNGHGGGLGSPGGVQQVRMAAR